MATSERRVRSHAELFLFERRQFLKIILFFLFLQQGYFRTSLGSFFIEPIEDYVDEDKNILHILYKIPPVDAESKSFDVTNSHGEFRSHLISLKILSCSTKLNKKIQSDE